MKSPSKNETKNKPLTLHLDMEKYLGQLESWDIPEHQQREFISTLWNLLLTFAEIGFDISPVQQADSASKTLPRNMFKSTENTQVSGESMLQLKHNIHTQNCMKEMNGASSPEEGIDA